MNPTGLLDQAKFPGQCLVVGHLLLHVAVQLFAGHGEREQLALVTQPDPGGNFVFLASDGALPAVVGARVLDRAEVERLADGAEPLKDDDAPADQLLTPRA